MQNAGNIKNKLRKYLENVLTAFFKGIELLRKILNNIRI
jgi:hypothetical protein